MNTAERTLTRSELDNYKAALEARLAELVPKLKASKSGIQIGDRHPDPLDSVISFNEREVEIRRMEKESEAVRQVTAALRRIKGGEFGDCEHCGEQIARKRLAAVPWASHCIQCESSKERHQAMVNSGEHFVASPVGAY